MTTQEPTLAQQIEYQQQLCENYQPNPVVYLIAKTILASLRRLQAIEQDDCVRVPRDQVEAAVKAEREECANVAESERMEGPAPVGQIHPEIILAVEMTCRETGKSIAEKIRARSQP